MSVASCLDAKRTDLKLCKFTTVSMVLNSSRIALMVGRNEVTRVNPHQEKMDAPPQWNVCMTSLWQGAGVRSQTDRYACMKGYDMDGRSR